MTGVQCVGSWQVPFSVLRGCCSETHEGKGQLGLHVSKRSMASQVRAARFWGVSWAPPTALLRVWSRAKPQITLGSKIREQSPGHGGKYPPQHVPLALGERCTGSQSCSGHRATRVSPSILCSGNRATQGSSVSCVCRGIHVPSDNLFHHRS